MHIDIIGYRTTNKGLVFALYKGLEYYLTALLSKQILKNLHVTIQVVRNLENKEDGYGFCSCDDTYKAWPKHYTIELCGSKSLKFMLQTLAHEAIHIKQYATRQMIYRGNVTLWEGTRYSDDDEEKHTYEELPWEKEAYSKEKALFRGLINKNIVGYIND